MQSAGQTQMRASPAPETRAEIDALAARLAAQHAQAASRSPAGAAPDPAPAVSTAASSAVPFTPEHARCETHGDYALNTRDADGTVRWYTPQCPACRRARAAAGLMRRAAIAPRFAHCGFDN